MRRIHLGRAGVARVLELQFDLGSQFFPDTPASGWRDNADLLVPDFFDPGADQWHIAVQSWVIEVDGLTVVVDTGVGNDRDRPHMAPLDHLNTAFLAALESTGVDPGGVDVVVNTHIHSDHVGWNTMLDGGAWVPTFPNARYLVPAADYRYFAPDGPAGQEEGNRIVFADSVLPVDGHVTQWSDEYRISESLLLRPAPGHTPGSSVLWLDAGRPAVFVGDLTHSPLQLRRPGDACAFDIDGPAAAGTRRRILTDAARLGAAVIPAHYPGHGGATIRAVEEGFDVEDWLGFEPLPSPPHAR